MARDGIVKLRWQLSQLSSFFFFFLFGSTFQAFTEMN